jgi:hypothetical protein
LNKNLGQWQLNQKIHHRGERRLPVSGARFSRTENQRPKIAAVKPNWQQRNRSEARAPAAKRAGDKLRHASEEKWQRRCAQLLGAETGPGRNNRWLLLLQKPETEGQQQAVDLTQKIGERENES